MGGYAHGENERPQYRFLGRGGDDAHHAPLHHRTGQRCRSGPVSPGRDVGPLGCQRAGMSLHRPAVSGAAGHRGPGGGAGTGGDRARSNRATYELHDRAGEFTSVLFTQQRYPSASELLLGGSIFPAIQNFLLSARALGLGACLTSWASYGGEQLLRQAVGVPDDWMLAGHVVVGWPRGRHGPVRRRSLDEVVYLDVWDEPADDIVKSREDPPGR